MALTADFLHEPIRFQYSIRIFSDLVIQFLFNKFQKVDSFLIPLFNSVKKRVGKLYQQPKICTFSRKLSNSKPNTSIKLVIIDWQNVKKTLHICKNNMQGLLQFLTPTPKIF